MKQIMLNKKYIIISIFLIIIALIVVGCVIKDFNTRPTPTPIPTITPNTTPIPTTTPYIVTPTPKPTPTAAPSPTPTIQPTPNPTPTSIFPVITKSPTDETVEEGGECYFIARYENATIAVWHFVSPDGQTDLTYIGAQEQFKPVEILNGMYSDLHLKNIPYSMNGWKVYCKYSNANGSAVTKTALITVIPAPATPVPTAEPTPTPTPVPTVEPTPIPTSEPTPSPEPTFVPSPDMNEILKTEFTESSMTWVEAIFEEYKVAEEEALEKDEEFVNENYLTEYEVDTEDFTLTITYDVTEEMFQNIIDNINIKRYEDKKEITLAESAMELLKINLDDIQHMQHCILILVHNDIEYYQLDLITYEILFIKEP